ncbi:SDR family NAD(P)-dependent oxidoreductase, partial [Flavobacteriaceae bacterium]|nr:SDR family NAD(P)-dependent oxidoreductase [Flavobacteriaceae bacterium]
ILKKGNLINGLRIYSISEIKKSFIDENEISGIILAIKTIEESVKKDLEIFFNSLNVTVLSPPDIDHWVQNGLKPQMIKPISYNSFIDRKKIFVNFDPVKKFYSGKIVLVTGSAGSIGSEISKQLSDFNLKKIILIDTSETALFNLLNELKKSIEIEFHMISVTNKIDLEKIFKNNSIDIVFHAAAFKHVGMCEIDFKNCINNNLFGTINVVDLSFKYDCEKFIMISTDKAVNPKSVMGISKRLCELYCLSLSNSGLKTDVIITRFGNVLGSNGSVLKIFENRFNKNLPLQVTDEKMTRYFMSIFEACQLVILSGFRGSNSDICIFDMGEAQNILKLAEKFIISKGLIPYEQYKIEITGALKSEKINEELFNQNEKIEFQANEKLMIVRSNIDIELKNIIIKDFQRTDQLTHKIIKGRYKKYET